MSFMRFYTPSFAGQVGANALYGISQGSCDMAANAGEAAASSSVDPQTAFELLPIPEGSSSDEIDGLRTCFMQGYNKKKSELEKRFYETTQGKTGLLWGAVGGLVTGVVGTLLVTRFMANPIMANPIGRLSATTRKQLAEAVRLARLLSGHGIRLRDQQRLYDRMLVLVRKVADGMQMLDSDVLDQVTAEAQRLGPLNAQPGKDV